ncbi:MAG: TIGR03545 family protein [Bacteroidota bacterium]
MRKKFVYFILVPVLLLGIIVYLFVDRWIESGLESAGEAIVGAKVEIDGFRVSLFPLAFEFNRLQVANSHDPWKNIFETGKVRAALDMGQLLRNKYIIETMEVNNLIIGTKRTTDGSIPKPPSPPPSSPSLTNQVSSVLTREISQAPVFDLSKLKKELKIDSLLDVHSFRSIQHIDTLKKQVETAGKQWEATLADVEKSKQKISEIEANIKAININELKTIESIATAIANVNSSYKNVNDLNEVFTTQRTAITNEITSLTNSVGMIDDLAKADYERVKRLAKLPDFSMQGIAKLLLGEKILSDANYYLSWVDLIKSKMPKSSPETENESPPRMKGQNIRFATDRSYPKFWIKKILISGGTDQQQDPEYYYGHGEVNNITTDQRVVGAPLTIALEANRGGHTSLMFDAMLDRRSEISHDHYSAVLSGVPVGSFTIGRSDFLPSKIARASAKIDAEVDVPGDNFDSHARIDFSDAAITFERAPQTDVERIVRDVLAAIQGFEVKVRLWKTADNFDVALSTDLDEQLAGRTKKVIGDEIARIENDIRQKVNEKINEKRQELEKVFNQKKGEIMSRINGYENIVNEKLALVDSKKKELEARIDQEKKKQLDAGKEKIEGALKGLFKKR